MKSFKGLLQNHLHSDEIKNTENVFFLQNNLFGPYLYVFVLKYIFKKNPAQYKNFFLFFLLKFFAPFPHLLLKATSHFSTQLAKLRFFYMMANQTKVPYF